MTTAIDLFAGLGGWSTGARAAGVEVLWAANHWPDAVEWHSANHPDTQHICQDLHQADWTKVPSHDILLASPCCQGHSKARGKSSGNPQHDSSRSTAWAVVSALEFHRPEAAIVENVPEFMDWALYPAWEAAMRSRAGRDADQPLLRHATRRRRRLRPLLARRQARR
jgi:site-specific DNA-cytosine methylase